MKTQKRGRNMTIRSPDLKENANVSFVLGNQIFEWKIHTEAMVDCTNAS